MVGRFVGGSLDGFYVGEGKLGKKFRCLILFVLYLPYSNSRGELCIIEKIEL